MARRLNFEQSQQARQIALSEVAQLFDPGDLKTTARQDVPEGWLFCDGAWVSRTTYADLFEAIGTTYGDAGGSATLFSLPDFRGRALVGQGNGGAGMTNRFRGDYFGSETHTLGNGQIPVHSHSGGTGQGGSHRHDMNFGGAANSPTSGTSSRLGNIGGAFESGFTETASGHTHSIGSSGSGDSHNNVQPSAVARILIKI